MIEKTFEKKWADNRQRLLQEDEEYQRILRSYRKHNWADALVAPAALIGSMEFVAWLGVKSQVLNFVISLVLAIVFFFVFLYFKAVRVSRKTLDEVERHARDRFGGTHHYPVAEPCDTPRQGSPYSGDRGSAGTSEPRDAR